MQTFESKVRTDFERYFTQFLEEFNYIALDSTVDEVIEVQLNKLEDKAENPEDNRKLEIIKNLKETKKKYTIDQQEILETVVYHENEEFWYG